jgi:hypothetical protein
MGVTSRLGRLIAAMALVSTLVPVAPVKAAFTCDDVHIVWARGVSIPPGPERSFDTRLSPSVGLAEEGDGGFRPAEGASHISSGVPDRLGLDDAQSDLTD